MPAPRRVAVTGTGAVSALGIGTPALEQGLLAGDCAIRPLTGIAADRVIARTAAQVPDFDPLAHFPARRLPQLDRAAQFALVAAREAWRAAAPAVDPMRAGAVLGAGVGVETFDAASRDLYALDARRLPPMTVPRIMPSAPASHLSIEFGLRGPSFAVASACASATHATGIAFHMIRTGLLDFALTGGTDASITLGFIKAWDALRVLSPDTCRPFSRDRNGLVIGEGAAVLVLEEWESARSRGASIEAEIVGFGMSADAGELIAPDRAGASQAIRAALHDAGLEPERVDHVNAHGTGTRLNDLTECAALREVFGAHLDHVPVTATKSAIGHCLNAGGALEVLATIMALRDGVIPPTVNFVAPDPQCPVDCVANVARHVTVETALSNSFAFGGLNATLILKRAE